MGCSLFSNSHFQMGVTERGLQGTLGILSCNLKYRVKRQISSIKQKLQQSMSFAVSPLYKKYMLSISGEPPGRLKEIAN